MQNPNQTPNLILFYDSDCGVCSRSVRWLIGQGGERILAVAYHDSTRIAEYPQIDRNHADSGVQALLAGQSVVFKDARAIAQCLCQSKSWRWLGQLIDLPPIRPLAALGYRIFARNRHHVSRLLGLTACKV